MTTPGPQMKGATKLEQNSDEARAIAALHAMQDRSKLSHRAANALIDRAARDSMGRYPALTGWCGKVGAP